MNKKLFYLLFLSLLFLSCKEKVSQDKIQSLYKDKIAVTDSKGQKVEIPANIKSIATFPAPHPHIIVYLDGDVKRIKGLHPLAKKAAEASVLSKIAPGILSIEDNFLKGSIVNIEEMLKINPDVFFTDQLLQGMEKMGELHIPVIYLGLEKEEINYRGKTREIYSPEKSIKEWVNITAAVLGTEKGKADAIFDEWSNTRNFIEEKIKSIPDEKKKKIVIVFKTNGNMFAGGNSFGQYWISVTGGINAAEDITGNHPAMVRIADFEQVLKWNPDIIYLTNFEETMPDDIYKNKIQGQDWSGTNAYKNKSVYKIPLGTYRWYPPSLDGPLMLKWMAAKNYPDLFTWNMEEEIKNYYEKYFNYSVTKEEILRILNPVGSGDF